jgi:hypothetical protein
MSRVLDDVEELLLPAALAVGGLYLLYWATQATEKAVSTVPEIAGNVERIFTNIINYDVPFVGEGDFIDRWTYNPAEAKSDYGRLKRWVGRYL